MMEGVLRETATGAMKRGPCSNNSAHWVQTESGKNIQNVGGYEQGPNDCLIDENCVRSLRIIFFSSINIMTGPSLAQQITFLEHRKMACNSCLIHKCLLH